MDATESTKRLLRRHEGLRLKPYADTVGKLSIGYGRNLDDEGISREEAEILLHNDLENVAIVCARVFPWYQRLDSPRQSVLLSMAYNLGVGGLGRFFKFLEALRLGNWEKASLEMLDSHWAEQVGKRAVELSEIIRYGRMPWEEKL